MEINFALMTTFKEVEEGLLTIDGEGRLSELNGDPLIGMCRALCTRPDDIDEKWDVLNATSVDPVLEKFALDLTHAENVFQLLKKTNISQDNSDWIDKELPTIKKYVALVNRKLQLQYESLSMLHTALKEANDKTQLPQNNSGCLGVVLAIIVAGISIIGTSVYMFI